jgi:hypothetical protein
MLQRLLILILDVSIFVASADQAPRGHLTSSDAELGLLVFLVAAPIAQSPMSATLFSTV